MWASLKKEILYREIPPTHTHKQKGEFQDAQFCMYTCKTFSNHFQTILVAPKQMLNILLYSLDLFETRIGNETSASQISPAANLHEFMISMNIIMISPSIYH